MVVQWDLVDFSMGSKGHLLGFPKVDRFELKYNVENPRRVETCSRLH